MCDTVKKKMKESVCCALIFLCFMRMKDLLLAGWMWVDITLDGVTTNKYYKMTVENSTYSEWALNYQEKLNTTKIETVSEGYFVCAILTWILPPLSFALVNAFLSILYPLYGLLTNETPLVRIVMFLLIALIIPTFGPIYLGILFLIGIGFVYIYVPLMALVYGILTLGGGSDFKNDDWTDRKFLKHIRICAPKYFPVLKLTELLFEALPQFVLALVFCINNYPYLKDTDVLFILPTTVFSMIFSFGSIIMGVVDGFSLIKQLLETALKQKCFGFNDLKIFIFGTKR